MARNFKETANSYFKKAKTIQQGPQAKTQYETDACVVREKTARLKLLRLAGLATELEAVVNPIATKAVPSL